MPRARAVRATRQGRARCTTQFDGRWPGCWRPASWRFPRSPTGRSGSPSPRRRRGLRRPTVRIPATTTARSGVTWTSSASPPTAGWSGSTPPTQCAAATSAASRAWSATPRWSASTTASRTASCTASATRAASTRSAPAARSPPWSRGSRSRCRAPASVWTSTRPPTGSA
jgi:hypothetical protein